jgi:hypothetical protein
MKLFRLFLCLLCFAASQLHAQENSNTTSNLNQNPNTDQNLTTQNHAVEISGTKDPELKSYRNMLKGLDAFEKYHKLAPNALLRFILKPNKDVDALQGLKLNIQGDTLSIPVEIASDGSFTLVRNKLAEQENADLVLNRKKASMRWRPLIRSEGVGQNQLRLGDLRLECEILWAIESDEAPFLIRNLFRLAGGLCHSSKISYNMIIPNLKLATLISGDRKLILADAKRDKFRDSLVPPLYDETWNDDAIIALELESTSIE